YCLVYNDYASLGNATSCAAPAQGTGDNGSVMGIFDQDNVNGSLSHTETYGYDVLNRLSTAVATGSSTYNLTFIYDRYGNMACQVNGQTQGLCPAYSFNQANNRIANSGYTYDAAGDLTSDGAHTYQWDAEGRFASEDGGATEVRTYNALGERARIVSQGTPLDLFFDPAGGPYLGQSGSYSLVWPLPGHRPMIYVGNDTGFFHDNVLNSTTMESHASGQVSEDLTFYPWGQDWALTGCCGYNFASIPYRDTVSNLDLARFRDYSFGQGRWLSPDPLGGDISNPQSLNRYSYALNNPTTLTDPLGLDPSDCVANDLGGVSCSGPDSITVYDGPPGGDYSDFSPGEPTLSALWDLESCQFWQNCYQPVSMFGGGDGSPPPPKPAPPNKGFTLGVRLPNQTFNQCMTQNASTYSLGGSLELTANVAFNRNSSIASKGYVSFFTGNSISSFLFGSAANAASAAGSNAPTGVSYFMGVPLTYGRRTSDIMSLNLEGLSGGPPLALGQASRGVQSAVGDLGDVLSLGMEFSTRLGIDAAFTGAEAIGCSISQ
ncbi:MAG: RHS repeat domain-containing protein, partial [Terriglobia bacterium]